MSDFVPNKLSINIASCQAELEKYADHQMEICAEHLMRIMRRQIEENGVGSWFMRNTAIKQVKEILHEVVDGKITIECGIDEAALKGAEEAVYVRTMVVLHGNEAEGKPLKTKPGQDTYGKHVTNKGPSSARTVHNLPASWSFGDVTAGIVENTMKEVKKYFDDMLEAIAEHIPVIIENYFTGG